MGRKKKIPKNDLRIPAYQMESLARVLLPALQKYLSSDEGRRDYEEWKAKKCEQKKDDSVGKTG